jgi:hypothetical protein
MKVRMIVMAMAAAIMCGCEKPLYDDEVTENVEAAVVDENTPTKKFTFTVKGDFGSASFDEAPAANRRASGYLNADGQDMTDLWVFDYMNGQCVQSVHQEQSSAGDAWGKPTMQLAYGSHHVYFVASRGDGPTFDSDGHAITWSTPRDAFWKDYDVNVVSTSNGNRVVTLDRVATRLKIEIADEIPASCAQVCVTPERWYYGWDYVNGVPVAQQQTERVVNVPEKFVGTTGEVTVSVFGLSGSSEWVTNVSITAKNGDVAVIGSASITGAPFKANRSTEYSGRLFSSGGELSVDLGADWESAHKGTW